MGEGLATIDGLLERACAAIFTQLLPFFDGRIVETLLQFEQDIYAQLGAATAA